MKRNNSGCFSSLFRRILCSGTPQTHPSDRFSGPDEANFVDEAKIQVQVQVQAQAQAPASSTPPVAPPGVVARLMGLDYLPENWVSKGNFPSGPVTRSRSVNFMDYLLEFDLKETKNRGVGKSVSFREEVKPEHDFLVVYLEDRNAGKKKETGEKAKQRKSEKQKSKKILKFKNEPRKFAGKNSPGNRKNENKDDRIERGRNSKPKTMDQKRKKRSQIRTGKVESEKNSVSVLNSNYTTFHRTQNYLSEAPNSMEMELSSNKTCNSIIGEVRGIKMASSEAKDMIEPEFSLKWSNEKGFEFEDYEELCMEFGEHLLNFMLDQVVDELVESHAGK